MSFYCSAMYYLTCLIVYGLRFRSIEDATIFTAAIFVSILCFILYPYAKREMLNGKIAETEKRLRLKTKLSDHWNLIPSKEAIENLYPQILVAMSLKSTEKIQHLITPDFKRSLDNKFKKWEKQKVDYSFVWMEINHVKNTRIVQNQKGDFVNMYVAGRSVDFLHEKGRSSAMGNQTRKKKEFQDIIVLTYLNGNWSINTIIRDAWFYQI